MLYAILNKSTDELISFCDTYSYEKDIILKLDTGTFSTYGDNMFAGIIVHSDLEIISDILQELGSDGYHWLEIVKLKWSSIIG